MAGPLQGDLGSCVTAQSRGDKGGFRTFMKTHNRASPQKFKLRHYLGWRSLAPLAQQVLF